MAQQYSPAFLEAESLISQEPPPPDAEQRLEELEKKARPEERPLFAHFWEALFVASDNLDIPGDGKSDS